MLWNVAFCMSSYQWNNKTLRCQLALMPRGWKTLAELWKCGYSLKKNYKISTQRCLKEVSDNCKLMTCISKSISTVQIVIDWFSINNVTSLFWILALSLVWCCLNNNLRFLWLIFGVSFSALSSQKLFIILFVFSDMFVISALASSSVTLPQSLW